MFDRHRGLLQAMFASSIPEIIELVGSRSKYSGELKREHGKRYQFDINKSDIESEGDPFRGKTQGARFACDMNRPISRGRCGIITYKKACSVPSDVLCHLLAFTRRFVQWVRSVDSLRFTRAPAQ